MLCKEFLSSVVYVSLVTCYARISETIYDPLHTFTVKEIYVNYSQMELFDVGPVFLTV